MFDTRTGGRLMHSVIRTARLEREIWHRLDAQGRTEFIEITDKTGDEVQRSRIRVGDDHVRVTSRGSRSGIIDQVLKVPENCVFATGSVLTEGMTCDPFLGSEVVEVVRYSVPLEDCAGIGCLETVQLVRGESSLDGEQRLDRIEVATASDRRTIWIDRERSIPVKLEAAWGVARLAP